MSTLPRSHITGRWAVFWATLLGGVGCLIGLVVGFTDDAELLSHAGHAVATVEDARQIGRDKSYLITFATPDGTPETLWTTFLHDDSRVGDRVSITYDTLRLDNLGEGNHVDLASVYLPAIFLFSVAVFLLWTAGSALKARPTGAAGWILSPRSVAGDAFLPSARRPSPSEKKRRRRRSQTARRSRKVVLTDPDPNGADAARER